MADREHLRILLKGGRELDQLRERLGGQMADLTEVDLSTTDLSQRQLSMINFDRADLSRASMDGSELVDCQFRTARLQRARLVGATVIRCDFESANLQESNWRAATIVNSRLDAARFGADLAGSVIRSVSVGGTDFTGAGVGQTLWSDTDLSSAVGLDQVSHSSASTIGLDTIVRSRGKIPESFLRGCGVPDQVIAYVRSVGQSITPIELYSCFISYSTKDRDFCQRLHNDLQAAGVRCWFAPEDLKIGAKIRDEIESAIRVHDKLLLVLSEHSVQSEWVATEVEGAFEREQRDRDRLVLFPVRLDDSVMETSQAWAADIRRRRQIGDFSGWKDHDAYQRAFQRLLRDLRADGGAE
jgi:hypothetical protein